MKEGKGRRNAGTLARRARCFDATFRNQEADIYLRLAFAALLLFTGASASCADRALSDEERIAPLVVAQGCWGGVINFVPNDRKFEVDGCRCGDAQKYRLEFDADLKLIKKELVR